MISSFVSTDYAVPVLIAFLTGIIGPAVVTYIKYILSLKKIKDINKRRDDFIITISTQQKINDTLNDLQ